MRSKIIATLVLSSGVFACKSAPKDLILNRWKAVDAYGDAGQKERYKKRFERHSTELEFAKDAKFFAYQDGDLQGTATYTMAPDGKSLAVNADGEGFTMRIVRLSADKLEAVTKGFMSSRDTIIYQAVK